MDTKNIYIDLHQTCRDNIRGTKTIQQSGAHIRSNMLDDPGSIKHTM